MSASREKKNRQAFAASGAADPKAVRAAEEKAKQRKSTLLYGAVAVAFVVVAVLVLLWNSNVIQRGKTALTIGDENYSARHQKREDGDGTGSLFLRADPDLKAVPQEKICGSDNGK